MLPTNNVAIGSDPLFSLSSISFSSFIFTTPHTSFASTLTSYFKNNFYSISVYSAPQEFVVDQFFVIENEHEKGFTVSTRRWSM